MKFLAVDDEFMAVQYMKTILMDVVPGCEVEIAQSGEEAIPLAESTDFDAIFMDIRIGTENGMDLARQIKEKKPRVNFIFTTGYADYMGDAFDLDASAYLLKPITEERVRHSLENLRYSTDNSASSGTAASSETVPLFNGKRVEFKCFGNFDFLIDGKSIHFTLHKSKELIAYLVSRKGVKCSKNEISAALWEDDDKHDAYYRKIKKDIVDTFKKYGIEGLVESEHGALSLTDVDKITCDYFDWLKGKESTANAYTGEFMAQYSWAEDINAILAGM